MQSMGFEVTTLSYIGGLDEDLWTPALMVNHVADVILPNEMFKELIADNRKSLVTLLQLAGK